jgi:hypothetical protein
MCHFQSQRSRVKIPRFGGVTDLQHDVTELAGLNHNFPPGAKALALLSRYTTAPTVWNSIVKSSDLPDGACQECAPVRLGGERGRKSDEQEYLDRMSDLRSAGAGLA